MHSNAHGFVTEIKRQRFGEACAGAWSLMPLGTDRARFDWAAFDELRSAWLRLFVEGGGASCCAPAGWKWLP